MLDVKIPPAVQVIIIALAMYAIHISVSIAHIITPYNKWLFLLLLVPAITLVLSGVKKFKTANTTVNPMHPEKSTSFIVDGPYTFSRNPMYLGFVLALIGWGIFLGSLPAFVMIPVFIAYMTRFQIMPEESALANKFGKRFIDYKSKVRRWI